jgi:hypothetical protein
MTKTRIVLIAFCLMTAMSKQRSGGSAAWAPSPYRLSGLEEKFMQHARARSR